MSSTQPATLRQLFAGGLARLTIGVLLLEFCAGITTYVTAVVVPHVLAGLHATGSYALILASTSVGTFLSFATASAALRRCGPAVVMGAGLAFSCVGAVASAIAPTAAIFALGRTVASYGSGLLGILGISIVITTLMPELRARLLSLTSAMWIVPGLLGPTIALALDAAAGWRWTILVPLPGIVIGRLLLRGAITAARPGSTEKAVVPLGPAMLLPIGMAWFVGLSSGNFVYIAWIGLIIALCGAWAIMPRGTFRAAVGPTRSLALLAITAFGFFGVDQLATTVALRADGIPIRWVALALGAAAFSWSILSLVQPRLSGPDGRRADLVLRLGLAAMAAAATAIVIAEWVGDISGLYFGVVWVIAGAGMGLVYPAVYVRATTDRAVDPIGADHLATGVLLAESLGVVLSAAVGAGVVQVAMLSGLSEARGLHLAMAIFAAALVGCVLLTRRPASR